MPHFCVPLKSWSSPICPRSNFSFPSRHSVGILLCVDRLATLTCGTGLEKYHPCPWIIAATGRGGQQRGLGWRRLGWFGRGGPVTCGPADGVGASARRFGFRFYGGQGLFFRRRPQNFLYSFSFNNIFLFVGVHNKIHLITMEITNTHQIREIFKNSSPALEGPYFQACRSFD